MPHGKLTKVEILTFTKLPIVNGVLMSTDFRWKGKSILKLIPKLLLGIQNVTYLMQAMWRMHFKALKTSWDCFSFLKFYFACLFQHLTLLCCGAGKYIPTKNISARPYFRHLGSVGWESNYPEARNILQRTISSVCWLGSRPEYKTAVYRLNGLGDRPLKGQVGCAKSIEWGGILYRARRGTKSLVL